MALWKRRILFVVLLIASGLAPALLIVPLAFASPDAFANVGEWKYLVLLGLALALPLPLLYFAAKAAVWADLRGGMLTVVASYWLITLISALGSKPDNLVRVMTFGLVVPGSDYAWGMPAPLVQLGTSSSFGISVPFWVLFLMSSYAAVKRVRLAQLSDAERLASTPDSPAVVDAASGQQDVDQPRLGAPLT